MRACCEHDDSLSGDVHRKETLIGDMLIRLPASIAPSILARQAAFEGCHARNFTAEIRKPIKQKLWLFRIDNAGTVVSQFVYGRDPFKRKDRSIWHFEGAFSRHVRM